MSNEDGDKQGTLFVAIDYFSDLIPVIYVTPYGGNGTHGLFAIPEIGTQILIAQPEGSTMWFYLGSIVKANTDVLKAEGELKDSPGQNSHNLLPDDRIYNGLGIPQRIGMKSPLGNSLILSDDIGENYQNVYTKLKSPKGKTLVLNDSNQIDSVIIRNEHGDHIKISSTSVPANGQAARMIEIECIGPVRLISHESSVDLRVVDGREINIENTSTGSKKNPGNPNGFGNINITSEYKDINLKVKGKDGNINIKSEGANSKVKVESQGTLDINVTQDVNIESQTQLTVTAPIIHLNP